MENSGYWFGPNGRRSRWRKWPFDVVLAAFTACIRRTPIYRWGRQNALDVRLVEFDLSLEGLPGSFDGYRILHVSDTHLDILPDLVPAVQGLLRSLDVV